MKLTKRQLKQIIREEHRRLQEAGLGDKYANPDVEPHLDQYDLEDKLISLTTEEFNKINKNDLKYPWSYENAKKSRKSN